MNCVVFSSQDFEDSPTVLWLGQLPTVWSETTTGEDSCQTGSAEPGNLLTLQLYQQPASLMASVIQIQSIHVCMQLAVWNSHNIIIIIDYGTLFYNHTDQLSISTLASLRMRIRRGAWRPRKGWVREREPDSRNRKEQRHLCSVRQTWLLPATEWCSYCAAPSAQSRTCTSGCWVSLKSSSPYAVCFHWLTVLAELARDWMQRNSKCCVTRGIISPVHDAYGKKVAGSLAITPYW